MFSRSFRLPTHPPPFKHTPIPTPTHPPQATEANAAKAQKPTAATSKDAKVCARARTCVYKGYWYSGRFW